MAFCVIEKKMRCAICPDGYCPADCPLAYFFPLEQRFRDESLAKAIKLFSGMTLEEVMRCMSDVKSVVSF